MKSFQLSAQVFTIVISSLALGVVIMNKDITPNDIERMIKKNNPSSSILLHEDVQTLQTENKRLLSEVNALKYELESNTKTLESKIGSLMNAFPNFSNEAFETEMPQPHNIIEDRISSDEEIATRLAQHLDDALLNDTGNMNDSESYQENIAEFFQSQGLASKRFDDIKCSDSLCRIIVGHSASENNEDILELIGEGPLSGGSYQLNNSDGQIVLYSAHVDQQEAFQEILKQSFKRG